ncbi:MAG: hypothetical protein A2W91_02885 [Bacteroidetes bacterium GWF2_38_335]|nr:MAG: hypothetical protein A2W91_02885 [Bacteroidetes bacterium GWF2_38_335]OFY77563.1 MAG: hypothetical protein A2281_01875 [Bacteroidetes bacterium RIFOXYA12_FULL_38_20]HBS87138.1 N-acetylmuramoyl-L-alanine amidase [Bacteroidales bacterium]
MNKFLNKLIGKRRFLFFLAIGLVFFFSTGQIHSQSSKYKVVIDAGHGGEDPGAVGKTGQEKKVVLSIALKLGKLIKDNYTDVEVIYTRSTDVFVELHKRAKIANDAKADLFISIHANGSKKPTAQGTDTWIMGLHKSEQNLETAMLENAAILKEENYLEEYEGFDPKSPGSYIIFNLLQSNYLELSSSFAKYIQNNFKTVKRVDRGVNQAGFLVLWKTAMPSVLVETGFITNPEEEKFLLSDKGQDTIAESIFKAFEKYRSGLKSRGAVENYTEVIDTVKKDTAKIVVIDDNKIVFKVQIKSSKTKIDLIPDNFKGLMDVNELIIDDSYKYYCGSFNSKKEADERQKKIKELYPDSFIVAFKGSKKIPISEALKEIKN